VTFFSLLRAQFNTFTVLVRLRVTVGGHGNTRFFTDFLFLPFVVMELPGQHKTADNSRTA
jgi:hypothetical protein